MALADSMRGILTRKLDEVARTIEAELKEEARGKRARVQTGMASASIHIEEDGEFSRFVGAIATFPKDGNDGGTHLYYMDKGNSANSGGVIKPTTFKALHLKDGTYASYVRPYSGTGLIKEVADRHR